MTSPTFSKEVPTRARRKRCSECGKLKDEVLGRQKLCEDCEQNKSYCTVCDWWEDRAWCGCRHVKWDSECGMECGCGATEITPDDHKESFLVLLSKLYPLTVSHYRRNDTFVNRPLLPLMKRLIAANNFWTQWHGPLIGGPPDLAFRYEKVFPQHTCVLTLIDIRSSEQEKWGSDAIDEMQLGMAWLTSLDDKTVEANKITAKWIQAFIPKEQP